MSWELFNEIYVKRKSEFHPFESSVHDDEIIPGDYYDHFLDSFARSYNRFVSENANIIESLTNNFVIDFEPFKELSDNSGYTAFWVQVINPSHYYPKSGPFEKILIKGVMFEIRCFEGKQIENSIERPVFQYEICGWFHPIEWRGRNHMNYAPIGKITFAGFDRILSEKFEFNHRGIYRAINQDFAYHFYKCLSYYFL